MSKGTLNNIVISGIATSVPNQVRPIDYWYQKFGVEAVDKFKNMTGVTRVCCTFKNQTASDLAFVSAKKLLEHKNIDPQSIGALIFISQCPDYRLPSTACVLQYRLNLSNDSICYDVNLGCSGYINGLMIISSLMQNANIKYALLLVGDTSTKGLSHDDKSSAMLFGDAGSATLLEKKENVSDVSFYIKSDGVRFKSIIKPAGAYRNLGVSKEKVLWPIDGNIRSDYDTYMNGTDVFTFTLSEVPALIKGFLHNHDQSINDYDWYIFHQANLYILKQIAKKTKIPIEKIPISLDNFGNTSVTSIPLTLSNSFGNVNDKIYHFMMCGFGVGLSWGIFTASIKTEDILPIIYTEDYFKEGE